jgi:hypothetical protein
MEKYRISEGQVEGREGKGMKHREVHGGKNENRRKNEGNKKRGQRKEVIIVIGSHYLRSTEQKKIAILSAAAHDFVMVMILGKFENGTLNRISTLIAIDNIHDL